MNRRTFLGFLFALPVARPVALKAIVSAPATIRRVILGPTATFDPETVNQYSTRLWMEMPEELYWSKFLGKDESTLLGGAKTEIIRIRHLPEPP